MKELTLPLQEQDVLSLKAGDVVLLTGTVYTARDAAHKRLSELLNEGKDLPIELKNACIYYAGPCPAAPGEVIGPCGPTTSGRVDAYTPQMIGQGLNAMIGKGMRSDAVKSAMQGKAVYFAATGGAGLLIARCIKEAKVVAFEDLGAEAIRALKVENFPAIVAIDAFGNDLYEQAVQA